MRDHGGDLDRAKALYGGADWIDLSTGINPIAYPVPQFVPRAFEALPTAEEITALETDAAIVYATDAGVVALAGAQAAIQLVPRLRSPGKAKVLTPTYNEHAAALLAQGWDVTSVKDMRGLAGADLAIVVNPNNPDGQSWRPEDLKKLGADVGLLVVDESFADPTPELSLAGALRGDDEGVLILRSFGKFYGLAGIRLGFGIGGHETTDRLRALSGPWSVSGPAIATGRAALSDAAWKGQTIARLAEDSARLDRMTNTAGWSLVGGTTLFRTYETEHAVTAQERLAKKQIWTRIFPYSKTWLRMGLPGTPDHWERLETALASRFQ